MNRAIEQSVKTVTSVLHYIFLIGGGVIGIFGFTKAMEAFTAL